MPILLTITVSSAIVGTYAAPAVHDPQTTQICAKQVTSQNKFSLMLYLHNDKGENIHPGSRGFLFDCISMQLNSLFNCNIDLLLIQITKTVLLHVLFYMLEILSADDY